MIAAIIFLSLTPHPIKFHIPYGDKLNHLLAYATLMAWWSQLHVSSARRLRLALSFAALGIVIEYAQGYTATRQPDVFDALANIAGILLGWLAAPPRIPSYYAKLAAVFPGSPG
ncbi:MAG TPA: VanZ family protein [Thiobacillaceae bacterium]|nr:VanZ family protein [Thiobacillaceae bacterium]